MKKIYQRSHIFYTNVKKLFSEFEDISKLKKWFYLHDYLRTKITSDFTEGGTYSVETFLKDGTKFSWMGTYLEIEQDRHIEYSWNDSDVRNSTVKLDFTSLSDNRTNLQVSHEIFPNNMTMLEHKSIWDTVLLHLDDLVDNPALVLYNKDDYDDLGSYY
ncbi:MAG: SRPBCC domain-containing protein [Bacteriovoracaceae bacterium]|jgi:uncharacterized protein YndB with AHSA1/START domain|nr:SRPBCC domain-containing protein [Bacteriovoracaceae bacterium]